MKLESQLTRVNRMPMLTMLGCSHYETSLVTCAFQKLSLRFVIRLRFG